ncbi:MAG TPA: hypothetical protein VE569_03550, partial [Acidimicrobiia bacterium]|nr:hypothetical protein [Acidimicrobiia bacterium]
PPATSSAQLYQSPVILQAVDPDVQPNQTVSRVRIRGGKVHGMNIRGVTQLAWAATIDDAVHCRAGCPARQRIGMTDGGHTDLELDDGLGALFQQDLAGVELEEPDRDLGPSSLVAAHAHRDGDDAPEGDQILAVSVPGADG